MESKKDSLFTRPVWVALFALSAKGFAERVATEILNLQPVAFLSLLQNHIYALNGKNSSFLADEDRCANTGWANVVIALGYVLPQLRV